jgi:hypothetical protein
VAPEAAGSNPVAHPKYYEGLAPGADPFFWFQVISWLPFPLQLNEPAGAKRGSGRAGDLSWEGPSCQIISVVRCIDFEFYLLNFLLD